MLVYDQELYDDLYSTRMNDGRMLHYSREFLNLQDPPHWTQQRKILAKQGVMGRILIVGCGFSPLLTAFSVTDDVWGTDPSPFIQRHKREESDAPERIRPYAIPDRRINRHFDWLIVDDVAPGYTVTAVVPVEGTRSNPEFEDFLQGCDDLSDNVIHFVTTKSDGGQDPRLTWLSLEQWASFAPDHTWIDNVTLEVWNAN